MRVVTIGATVFLVPEAWTRWQSRFLEFERRYDRSIWCRATTNGHDAHWRCVDAPLLLSSRELSPRKSQSGKEVTG